MNKIFYADLLYRIYGSPKEIKKQFLEEALTWDYYPVYRNNETVALYVVKGNRIYFGCLPEYKGIWFQMKMWKRLCKNIILKYGKVETSTFEDTKELVERLGFKEVSRNENIINFIKTEV